MKKNRCLFVLTFVSIIAIGICVIYVLKQKEVNSGDELDLSTMSARDYIDVERDFIDEYNIFLQSYDLSDVKMSKEKSIGIDGTLTSDFAILTLDTNVYGSSAFAFLPIDSRELTDEEMYELATAFNGVDGEIVIRDYCSYKYAISDEIGIDSNRSLTSREFFLIQVKVASEYFTAGKQPKNPLAKSNESQVLCYTTCNNQEVWIYPTREMTEEEILQILDYKYGDINKDFYTPKEGQLSADDAKVKAEELLQTHVSKLGKVDEIYVLYSADEPTTDGKADCWKAYIHMKNSTNDYFVKFSADTGNLVELIQGEKNYYTEEHYLEAKLNGEFEVIAE